MGHDEARLRALAEEHGQGHIFRWWDELDDVYRDYLLGQVAAIDFAELDRLIDRYVLRPSAADLGELEPAEPIAIPTTPEGEADRRRARGIGEDAIRAGHVAALVVAGGLGTRLRYVPPKGTYPAAPVTGKSLFQLHAEKIVAARRRYGATVPWYIMTSEATDAPTRDYFAEHDCFGLGADNVMFFEQAASPSVGPDGRLLLAEKGALATSPNGHGGCLQALGDSGALADMARRGIRVISYFQVDNPLIKLLDPVFLGYHIGRGSEFSSKALPKRDAEEGLGVFCYKVKVKVKVKGEEQANGSSLSPSLSLSPSSLTVVEYSDLPPHYKYAMRQDGSLVFSGGNIAIHAISVGFFQRLLDQGISLPCHRAFKKVKCIDDEGRLVDPAEPNGIRFEKFIFDAVPHAQAPVVLMADRAEEFAPIKRAEGEDSPATARQAQCNLFGCWLEQGGVAVPRGRNGDVLCAIEISPLVALDADELRQRLPPGTRLTAELNLQRR